MLAVSVSIDRYDVFPRTRGDGASIFPVSGNGDWGSILLRQICLRLSWPYGPVSVASAASVLPSPHTRHAWTAGGGDSCAGSWRSPPDRPTRSMVATTGATAASGLRGLKR